MLLGGSPLSLLAVFCRVYAPFVASSLSVLRAVALTRRYALPIQRNQHEASPLHRYYYYYYFTALSSFDTSGCKEQNEEVETSTWRGASGRKREGGAPRAESPSPFMLLYQREEGGRHKSSTFMKYERVGVSRGACFNSSKMQSHGSAACMVLKHICAAKTRLKNK